MRPGLNTTLSASRLAVMRTGKTARFCQRNLSGPNARVLLAALLGRPGVPDLAAAVAGVVG